MATLKPTVANHPDGTIPAGDDADVLVALRRWRDAGQAAALITVVDAWGSAPRPVGSQLAVNDALEFVGSVSGGCIEGAVIERAQDVMRSGRPERVDFGISNEQAWEVGLACGGKLDVYIERVD